MTASQTKILFCDALPVYEKLLHDDLIAPDVMVLTRSFVMAKNMKKTAYIDGNINVDQRKHFKFGILDVEQRLIKQFDILGVSEPEKNIFYNF